MYRLKKLPFKQPITSLEMYKILSEANLYLGELKGILEVIDHPRIIIKLINIGEAKTSCEIENIVTTYDDIFKEMIVPKKNNYDTNLIVRYMRATNIMYRNIILSKEINQSSLAKIQELIEPNNAGYRSLPGIKIYNKNTNKVIYVPPQNKNEIAIFFENLLQYINNDLDEYDPLIKMALIHYQFECIHPYIDGNGRTGRILNVNYLVYKNRLSYPILNLSKYLRETKEQYFELLTQTHNDSSTIDMFVIYMLKAIRETTRYTINFVHQVSRIMEITDQGIKQKLPKIYSKELVLHLFQFMYTKNELFRVSLNISRTTATKYLKELVKHGFLVEEKYGKETIYKNMEYLNFYMV